MGTDPSAQPRPRIATDQEPTSPRARIFTALAWARLNDMTVVADSDPHVVCNSTHAPVWELAPKARHVSPVGAAILLYQPHTPELERACVMALGVTARWLEGFDVGISGFKAPANWDRHIAANLIRQGYQLGLEIRKLATSTECRHHPGVIYSAASACWKCASENETPTEPGVVVENCLDEDANTTPMDPGAGGGR